MLSGAVVLVLLLAPDAPVAPVEEAPLLVPSTSTEDLRDTIELLEARKPSLTRPLTVLTTGVSLTVFSVTYFIPALLSDSGLSNPLSLMGLLCIAVGLPMAVFGAVDLHLRLLEARAFDEELELLVPVLREREAEERRARRKAGQPRLQLMPPAVVF